MYRTLAQHPLLLKPVRHKGVHYFDVHYDKSVAWYRAHFALQSGARRLADRYGVRPLPYESSPYYMFHPLAPERISATLPGVKALVLLRDPVERAYSAHAHETARGFETLPFAEALAAEPRRLAGEVERLRADPAYESHAHRHQAYRSRGQYIEHVRRLAEYIGRENVHVVDSHRFFQTPEAVYDEVMEFLGVPKLDYPEFERHNARARSEMDPALRAELEAHFAPYDAELAEWLGWSPSWYR